MDLGLNHVVRKYSAPVDEKAHMLMQVPADPLGPSGVIVVSENSICYKKYDHEDRQCFVPRRNDQLEQKGLFFTCYSILCLKGTFFFLLQSELGDLYKVTLQFTKQVVHGITIQYFDTIQACNSINILKTGFVFAAAEYSNHLLFNFLDTGDDEPIKNHSTQSADQVALFNPRDLQNLSVVDEFQNLASINDLKVEDLIGEGSP
jgi:splicing factor 3B subunit 3